MMKHLTLIIALIVAVAAIGCHGNTGHSFSTEDPLTIHSTSDWAVTWTLTAPEAERELKDRIRDAVWNYQMDDGPWHQTAFVIIQLDANTIVMQTTVPKSEIVGSKEVKAYPVYEFDGAREGDSIASDPRKFTIE